MDRRRRGGGVLLLWEERGDIKIKEGWVVATSGYVMRDTLKKLLLLGPNPQGPSLFNHQPSTLKPDPSALSPLPSALLAGMRQFICKTDTDFADVNRCK